MLPKRWQKIKMGNTLQNKVIQFHEKIVFDFLKEIRNYLVANSIIRNFSFSKNLSLYPTSPHSSLKEQSYHTETYISKLQKCFSFFLPQSILLSRKITFLLQITRGRSFRKREKEKEKKEKTSDAGFHRRQRGGVPLRAAFGISLNFAECNSLAAGQRGVLRVYVRY